MSLGHEFGMEKKRPTPRAADGASAPLGSVTLPAGVHFDQATRPVRPAANAFRWADNINLGEKKKAYG